MALALVPALLVSAHIAGTSARADDIVPNPAMLTAVARIAPTPVPTDQVPFQPAIDIVRVDMLRRVGGTFVSTRQIRIGNIARYVVFYRTRNRGTLLPHCHFSVANGGRTFYDTPMWRKHGRNYFYIDGRFSAVVGKTIAIFSIRLGPARAVGTLVFDVKLPKF